jgi:hypothetical protein
MCAEVDSPPEGVDPGQWALDQYRAWRVVHMGDGRIPTVGSMDELMARMREEPSR